MRSSLPVGSLAGDHHKLLMGNTHWSPVKKAISNPLCLVLLRDDCLKVKELCKPCVWFAKKGGLLFVFSLFVHLLFKFQLKKPTHSSPSPSSFPSPSTQLPFVI